MFEYDISDQDSGVEHDRLASAVWAGMLIWAGIVLLAGFQGWLLAWSLPEMVWFSFLREWLSNFSFDFRVLPLIFLGDALLLLLEFLIRLVFPTLHHKLTNILINMIIFICLTLGSYGLIQGELILPVLLIALGFSILLGIIFRRRVAEK